MSKGTVASLSVALLLAGGTGHAKPERACSKTAEAARRACVSEASADHWIAVGVCLNLADAAARSACLDEANDKEALKEERAGCKEQDAAREELCDALGQAPYDPVLDPAGFLSPAQTAANPNPYFPLVPGTTHVYQGAGETVTVTVTDRTREILGVTAIVVRDVVTDDEGAVLEDTDDWFAQDVAGNVWYLGELSMSFEDGLLSLEGSWQAGVDGAKPGIVMKAAPMVGDLYRQEFALGSAEDVAEVIGTTGTESVPAATCTGTCVVTRDFTPLEPDVEEHKYYAPGIGLILEVDLETGERLELVS